MALLFVLHGSPWSVLWIAYGGPAPLTVSDASKDFTLLVELGTAAGDALRSRLTLQQAERDGGAKTTALAIFIPRCNFGALAYGSAFMHAGETAANPRAIQPRCRSPSCSVDEMILHHASQTLASFALPMHASVLACKSVHERQRVEIRLTPMQVGPGAACSAEGGLARGGRQRQHGRTARGAGPRRSAVLREGPTSRPECATRPTHPHSLSALLDTNCVP